MGNEYTDDDIEIIHIDREEPEKRVPKRRVQKGRKWKEIVRKCTIAVGVMGILGTITGVSLNAYVINKYKDKIITVDECKDVDDVDCVMVLGAHVRADGSPCYMLQDRLNKAVEIYDVGITDRMLMTGDHGQAEYDEVNSMKNYAAGLGVERDNIFMDHAGFSTYESMYRAKEVFGVKKMVIVTQEYHMYRAIYIANKLGIDAYGVCAEDIEYSGQTKRDIREMAARIKDIVTVLFKIEPTYLGEEIPISGSGSATDDKKKENELE